MATGQEGSIEGRIPPGQHLTDRFPVLHAGGVQHVDNHDWTLRLSGLVSAERTVTWEQLMYLPAEEILCDIHCVTGWTKLDTRWRGVRVPALLEGSELLPDATFAVIHAEEGWTTSLPVEELFHPDVLIAYEYEGRSLAAEHGGPVRLLVPRLYFWKSAKWLSGIEFVAEDRPGYWESSGYHPLGDPWLEQRYS